jgi:hypothetical protein
MNIVPWAVAAQTETNGDSGITAAHGGALRRPEPFQTGHHLLEALDLNQDSELLAADAPNQSPIREHLAELPRRASQYAITDSMTVGVVDMLEVVNVGSDEDQQIRFGLSDESVEQRLRLFEKPRVICQPAKPIVPRQISEAPSTLNDSNQQRNQNKKNRAEQKKNETSYLALLGCRLALQLGNPRAFPQQLDFLLLESAVELDLQIGQAHGSLAIEKQFARLRVAPRVQQRALKVTILFSLLGL